MPRKIKLEQFFCLLHIMFAFYLLQTQKAAAQYCAAA